MSDSVWPQGLGPVGLLCPWHPGKNTGVGCHALLQGLFPTQGSNLCLFCLLHWQIDSYHWCHLGSSISVNSQFFSTSLLPAPQQCQNVPFLQYPPFYWSSPPKQDAIAAAAKLLQSCLTPCDPTDSSPPGFPVPGVLQARNTGVGCHFLLQCMKVNSESEVALLCPTLSDPMDCSPPGSSAHGIFQARVVEWAATAFSRVPLLMCFLSLQYFSLTFVFNFGKVHPI